jgi:hypothetical protein
MVTHSNRDRHSNALPVSHTALRSTDAGVLLLFAAQHPTPPRSPDLTSELSSSLTTATEESIESQANPLASLGLDSSASSSPSLLPPLLLISHKTLSHPIRQQILPVSATSSISLQDPSHKSITNDNTPPTTSTRPSCISPNHRLTTSHSNRPMSFPSNVSLC